MKDSTRFSIEAIGRILQGRDGPAVSIDEPYRQGLLGLDEFSHIHVIWAFDQAEWDGMTLRLPPCYRLLEHEIGLFATRGPFRPNPIATSLCRLVGVDAETGILRLDWIDAEPDSPVLDLKPFHPSSDSIADPKMPSWCAHWPKDRDSSGSFDWSKEFTF